MKIANKILYIGAGLHIEITIDLKETKEFIMIDTQPRAEYNDKTKYVEKNYKYNFVNNLKTKCKEYGFSLSKTYVLDTNYENIIMSYSQCLYYSCKKKPEHINPIMLYFINELTGQTLRYYISTNIKYNITAMLSRDIETSDGLIVTGYNPDKILLDLFTVPKIFIGYTNRCYIIEDKDLEEEKETIIYFLQICKCSIQYYFTDFYKIDSNTGQIEKYNNYGEFIKDEYVKDKIKNIIEKG